MSRSDLLSMTIAEYFMIMAQKLWMQRESDEYLPGNKSADSNLSFSDIQKLYRKTFSRNTVIKDPE